ncbi:MAG: site-2 protease family protein [Candidatus Omnitrophota bacterium]|jgi:Zn-dependent protease|nr:MAG: site-2 protease family protein [Candidatus Omnitrophota bacterium]
MKWSWKLGKVFGIEVAIHATFYIIIAWVVLLHWMDGDNLSDTVSGVGFVLALFICVILHEFGHALMARRFNIKTRDITLLPIGGLARLEKMPEKPHQELLVALAGPAVNVVIAVLLLIWLLVTATVEPLHQLSVTAGPFIERLMIVNIFLVIFNLLPAFPMDGGRVVRALLATRLEYARATRIAASLGQGMAFLFGFLGFFVNPFLIFIAFFVWIGAEQEAGMVEMKSVLGGAVVRNAMVTDFRTLASDDRLARAVELVLSGSQQDFPVMEENRLIGILTHSDLLVALATKGQDLPVIDVMRRDFQIVEPWTLLEHAFILLKECRCQTIPVLFNQQLIGLLTKDNVSEFVMIQTALKGSFKEKAHSSHPAISVDMKA